MSGLITDGGADHFVVGVKFKNVVRLSGLAVVITLAPGVLERFHMGGAPKLLLDLAGFLPNPRSLELGSGSRGNFGSRFALSIGLELAGQEDVASDHCQQQEEEHRGQPVIHRRHKTHGAYRIDRLRCAGSFMNPPTSLCKRLPEADGGGSG